MFGLMRKSEHERICRNLHSHINYHAEGNRKHCEEIQNMKKQLELENRRATYWKMKFLEPDKEPIILGSKEDVEYIKAWVFYSLADDSRTQNCAIYHVQIISCTYVYLACKSVYVCWCGILGWEDLGANLGLRMCCKMYIENWIVFDGMMVNGG